MEIIKLPFKIKSPVLAVGAQSKNTICFMEGERAYLSPLHPDLSEPKDFAAFQKDLGVFLKKGPKIIACDLHAGYSSTSFVSRYLSGKYKIVSVQHHHAHIASCMLESGLRNQKVIGVAFDGTGMGEDNTLWGGEFLLCDYAGYKRMAHLEVIPLLGGEQAIREPWRLSAAWLYRIYKDKFLKFEDGFVRGIKRKDWQLLKQMYLKGFNFPVTSSMGRLFDAASSLILKKYKANFEGELAIALEKKSLHCKGRPEGYFFAVRKEEGGYIIGPEPIFKSIVAGLKRKEPAESLALRFHLGVAGMIKELSLRLRKDSKVNKVMLSGGVFQNKCLLKSSTELLYKAGFEVFWHRINSCNDSSLSLGQGVIANFKE